MKKIVLPILLILILAAIVSPSFLIKVKTTCSSQFGQCPEELQSEVASFNGKSLYLAKRGIKKSLNSNFLVSQFGFQFNLPNILGIHTILKKPAFALKGVDSYALIGDQGTVLAVEPTSTLPAVIVEGTFPKVGENVSSNGLFALEIIDGVYKMYQTRTGRIEGTSLLVDLPSGVRVIFPLEDSDSDYLLGSLRLIYADIQQVEGANYSEIDLRYKNPVLR